MHSNLPQGAPWNEKSYVGCTPTQNLVDAYDMKDGTEPITGYDANGQPIINKIQDMTIRILMKTGIHALK